MNLGCGSYVLSLPKPFYTLKAAYGRRYRSTNAGRHGKDNYSKMRAFAAALIHASTEPRQAPAATRRLDDGPE